MLSYVYADANVCIQIGLRRHKYRQHRAEGNPSLFRSYFFRMEWQMFSPIARTSVRAPEGFVAGESMSLGHRD